MKKIVATGDWHMDARTAGFRRFGDVRAAVQRVVGSALELGADAFIFLGDLCDPGSPLAYKSIEVAIEAALELACGGIMSYWLTGNHDVVDDGSGSSVLEPLKALMDDVVVVDRPMVMLESYEGAMDMIGLPYVSMGGCVGELAKISGGSIPLGEWLEHSSELVIVASHLSVPGAEFGSETHNMPRGREMVLPVRVLQTCGRKVIVLQGHYHRRQVVHQEGFDVHVAGSLERLRFGEEDNTPGYLVLEV